MTDASRTVVWLADYKPFGEATITVSTITNNLRFPGQYFDAETGLNYNYFRDYNPALGRYIEADPIGIKRGKNHLYVYVENNPINLIDPEGLLTNTNKTTYVGGEAHFILGGGVETFTCCNKGRTVLLVFGKVCFGAGFGASVAVGGVYNVGDDCAMQLSGWSAELGAGPFEVSVSASKSEYGNPTAFGSGFGRGGKATLCYYVLLKQADLGCCKK